ncbi:MAG: LuxR C-terminal-related transcriptional regulator [Pseudomonadota bacterium]
MDSALLQIYDLIEVEDFVEQVAHKLRDALKVKYVKNVGIWICDQYGNIDPTSYTTDLRELSEPYFEYYAAINPIMPKLTPTLMAGHVAKSSDAILDRDYRRTEFFNEYVRQLGYFHEIGFRLHVGIQSFSVVTFQREIGSDDYDSGDFNLMRYIQGPLSAAFRLRRRITHSNDITHSVNRLIVSKSGYCEDHAGALVNEMIANGALRLSSGKINVLRQEKPRFFDWLRHASNSTNLPQPFCFGANGFGYVLDMKESLDAGRFEISVTRSEKHDYHKDVLSRYKVQNCLTNREMDLLCALTIGLSVSEFSEQSEISINTARTHCKRLLMRMGVSTQTKACIKFLKELQGHGIGIAEIEGLAGR